MSLPCPACGRYTRRRLDGRIGCDSGSCPRGEPAAFTKRIPRRPEPNTVNLAAVERAAAIQRDRGL